jgi:signal transduction histidine kinase
MSKFALLQWLKNVSIAKKLYFTVGIMALLIGIELFTLFFSISTLSSVRAYVGGEGLWSKSQKNAIYHLTRYATLHNEDDYIQFKEHMKVPLGDNKARAEMSKPHPDWEKVKQGLIEGRNHPEDVEGMIHLFRRFSNISYIRKAIMIWGQADSSILKLIPISDSLHTEINRQNPSVEKTTLLLEHLVPINRTLTVLEDDFSYTLGEGSRWLEGLILKLLFVIALTVEVSGLILAISLSRGIQKGLNGIISAAAAFAKGDFTTRAKVYSKDEIGVLATSFNEMSEKLESGINEREKAEQQLNSYTSELEQKNKELEQFAYVASHDLQEPLNTVLGFVRLFKSGYTGKLDEQALQYLNFITEASDRMKNLIKALLDYSRIGTNHHPETVDCNQVMQEIVADLDSLIREKNVEITCGKLPTLKAYPVELKLLLQNLINNAIKFQQQGKTPGISVTAGHTQNGWLFAVKDNGIGIKKEFWDKIFVIFQRLHLRSEYDGTGIGLSQCTKIAALHNGKIWVESEYGAGSTFYFTLNVH